MPFVQSNEIRMYYEERGQGTPLVLLMGLGADGSLWEEHVKVYETRFRCILVDNRGAGQTDKPEGPYSIRTMAEDTVHLMDAIGLERAHVSGISMGSAIAQEIGLAYPERVISLSLHASWSECDPYTARIFETFGAAYGVLSASAFTRLLQLWIFTPEYHSSHMSDLLAREQAGERQPNPMPVHAFRGQCDACIGHDTRGRLSRIDKPALLTVGSIDIFTPERCSAAIKAEMPHAEFIVFPGSGHTHHWDQLDAFNAKTLQFLLSNDVY